MLLEDISLHTFSINPNPGDDDVVTVAPLVGWADCNTDIESGVVDALDIICL